MNEKKYKEQNMIVESKKLKQSCFSSLITIGVFCWVSMCSFNYVFAQTDNMSSNDIRALEKGENEPIPKESTTIKPEVAETIDPEEEKIGRDAMTMILEITKSNNPFTKNKSASYLTLEEQKLKDREKHKKEMKEFNDRIKKKYLDTFKRFQKMRSQQADYSGMHYDYTAYLQNFLVSASR